VALLDERLKAQVDDLMRIQVSEYIDFIKLFTERANIMSKHFFVAVPYSPPLFNVKDEVSRRIFGKNDLAAKERGKDIGFEEHRSQLEQRMAIVQQGLVRCGIRTALLGTEEVIELLYKEFNPGELEKPISLVNAAPERR
jgi:hypothetical protein